jgi:hypothetical protein
MHGVPKYIQRNKNVEYYTFLGENISSIFVVFINCTNQNLNEQLKRSPVTPVLPKEIN